MADVQRLPLELRCMIYRYMCQVCKISSDMKEELLDAWFCYALRQLTNFQFRNSEEMYEYQNNIFKHIIDRNLSTKKREGMRIEYFLRTIRLGHDSKISSRWLFSYHGYDDTDINHLKTIADENNFYIAFQRWENSETDKHVYGYVLTGRDTDRWSMELLLRTTFVIPMGVIVQDYDRLYGGEHFGDEELYVKCCEPMLGYSDYDDDEE